MVRPALLVVDDEADSLRTLTRELESRYGSYYQIAASSSAEDALSPRHVPDRFIAIDEAPRTLNGKKCEVPVKKILTGTTPEQAVSQDALRNPDALKPFLGLGAS